MTDEQIIKALECCKAESDYTCKDCPCLYTDCVIEIGEALALIQRQKHQISIYKKLLDKAEERIAADRADAVMEFVERIKEESFHHIDFGDLVYCSDVERIAREMTEGEQ